MSTTTTTTTTTFRLSAKNLFLTYPQCGITKEDAAKQLYEKLSKYGVKQYIVAQELHADGQPHLHAIFELHRKTNIKDPRALDLGDCHGNYQACRNLLATRQYIRKDGNYISRNCTAELVSSCKSRKEVQDVCVESGIHTQYKFWLEYWHSHRQLVLEVANFTTRRWYEEVPVPSIGQALYLYGEPGTGKTSYTYIKFPNAFFCNSPRHFQHYEEEEDIVIGDFRADDWKEALSFLRTLITDQICFTPPYYGSKRIKWPRRVVIESNDRPSVLIGFDEAFRRRLVPYEVPSCSLSSPSEVPSDSSQSNNNG